MVEEFQKKKIQPIYDPDEFEIFCLEAGAETIFDNFQKAICTIRKLNNVLVSIGKRLFQLFTSYVLDSASAVISCKKTTQSS